MSEERREKPGQALKRKMWVALGCGLLAGSGAMAQAPEQPVAQQEKTPAHESAGKPQSARERAWQILDEGVTEKSTEKRAKATNALGLLPGNAEAEKAANEALKDEKFIVRAAGATALGSMHAVRSIPELESALDDQEPTVVLAAANSLMLLRANSAYDVYYSVLTGNMRTNKGLIQEQFRTLRDTKKMAELGFEEGIGFVPFAGFGYSLVKTVVKAENDSSPVRAAAAKKLANDPDPAAAEALVTATHDKSWIIRAAALDAIAQRGDKALLPHVIASLDDGKDEVRYTAAACIVHLSDVSAKRKKAVLSAR